MSVYYELIHILVIKSPIVPMLLACICGVMYGADLPNNITQNRLRITKITNFVENKVPTGITDVL